MVTLRQLSEKPWIWSFIGMFLVWLATAVYTGGTGSAEVISAALSFATFTVIVGIGQMFVITTGPGNVDLSIPSTIALSGAVAMKIMDGSNNMLAVGFAFSMGCGLVVGLFNYMLIRVLRIPPIIATLSSSFLILSTAIAYGRGLKIKPPPLLAEFATAQVLGIPALAVVFIFFAAFMSVVLNRTLYGRSVLAIGQNMRAAWLAGINVERIRFYTYVLSALLAALCGFLLAGFSGGHRRCCDWRHLSGGRQGECARPLGRGDVHVLACDDAQHLRCLGWNSAHHDGAYHCGGNHHRRGR